MDFFAVWLTRIYNVTLLIPRWMLVFASGTLASVIIGLLHKTPPTQPAAATQAQSANRELAAAVPQAKPRGSAKQRKTKT